MQCQDQSRFLVIDHSPVKGRYLKAKKDIPAYTNVASFGCAASNRVSRVDFDLDPDQKNKVRYVVRDLTDDRYLYSPTDSEMRILEDPAAEVDIRAFPCAFLVNEPFLHKSDDSPFYVPVEENVEIVRNDHTRQVYLMTTQAVQKGQELLWFYGHGYTCPRDYMVYAPELNLDYRVLAGVNRLIVYDATPQLPEAIRDRRGGSGSCTLVTLTKYRGNEDNLDSYYQFDTVPEDSRECGRSQAMTDATGVAMTYRLTRMAYTRERQTLPRNLRKKKRVGESRT